MPLATDCAPKAVSTPEPSRLTDGSRAVLRRRSIPAFFGLSLLVAAGLGGCSATDTTSAERFTETGQLVALSGGDGGAANACFTCHGLEGEGNDAGAPRLASIPLGYLHRQMEDFASGRRRHLDMEAIARRLSPRDRGAVAAYYSALPFASGPPAELPPAPELYVRGDPERGLPSCASCHGTRGEGIGPANPPLAGQPAAYLAEQIEQWRLAKRRNDPGNVMLAISQRLRPAEIPALSAYASALPGNSSRPVSQAASPAARRDDPRSDASAPRPRGAE